MAVHVAARVLATAVAGVALVSRTVGDLVARVQQACTGRATGD